MKSMKTTSIYLCAQCMYESPKWLGRCPACEAWNSFSENIKEKVSSNNIKAHAREAREFAAVAASLGGNLHWPTQIPEIDRVLGGGIVPGSLILLTGEPGIGKSTLTLQICEAVSKIGKRVLYISGEESEEQVAMRASRLGLSLANFLLLSENNMETAIASMKKLNPDFAIIDSIQVMSSSSIPGGAGGISQVRLCTEALLEFAKPKQLPLLLVGHVTKDGTLAGPRVLEHLVDTVLYIEGNRSHEMRILRSVKNRFGATSEAGMFEMTARGLAQVANPAAFLLKTRKTGRIGSALVMTMEGSRPVVVEVQALTNQTVFGYPKRTASGFDVNRLQVLIAVLEKYMRVNLKAHDVYVNVVSGYKLRDPAADLGICLAILSSHFKKALQPDAVAVGEVGLTGDVLFPKEIKRHKREIERLNLKIIQAEEIGEAAAAAGLYSK